METAAEVWGPAWTRMTEQLLGRGPQKIMSGALVFGDAICEIADLFIEAR